MADSSISFFRRLRFEPLENRRLLSADLVSRAAFPSFSAGGTLGAMSADGRYVVFTSDAESLSGFDIVPGVENVYRFDRVTGDVLLVSVNTTGTGGGNLDSHDPVISADGSVVAFYSSATNLHPLDKNSAADIFARNLITGTTYLVSVNTTGTGGGNAASDSPTISADGSVVAFRSTATNLHPLDNSTGSDIYARNLATGTTYLVSINSAGTGAGLGMSDSPVISADGSVVAFSSTAANLHPLDTSITSDVFVRNLLTGTTQLVSINSTGTASGNGASDSPAISANGSVVAFRSSASNLHPLDTNTTSDIFARNLTTGTTYLVSVNSTGTGSGNGTSDEVVISANGDVVAFRSSANDLDLLDSNINSDVFARNLAMSTTHLVSVHSSGAGSGTANHTDYSSNPAISADGNAVAFYSSRTDLDPLDTNTSFDAFARNLTTGITSLVSVNSAGSGGGVNFSFGGQTFPVISADGSVVAFESLANDLTAEDFNARADVFVRQLSSATVELASRADLDSPSTTAGDNSEVDSGALSADGRYLAFVSSAANLIDSLTIWPDVQNVYRLDRVTGHVDLVSINIDGTGSGNYSSYHPVISADGSVVAFYSSATNLHSLKISNGSDIFARNFTTGTTYLVSVNSAGTAGGNGSSYNPVISADGSVVAFSSNSRNLHPLATNGYSNVYARNLATSTTYLASISADGTSGGNNSSDSPVISADGAVVAFRSYASNLHSAKSTSIENDVFARNLVTGTTYLVSINSAGNGSGGGHSFDPVISANGNVVAFRSAATNLHALKTNGTRYDVFARNLVTGTTYLVSMSADGTSGGFGDSDHASISADGNVVAFRSSASNLNALDTDSTSDVFARNLATNTTYLVSTDSAGTGSGDGLSYDPVISADGSVVAFRSSADNMHPLKSTGSDFDVYARNLVTGTTYLMSASSSNTGSGNNDSQDAVISADGRVVAFDSVARNLAERDYNSSSDVFVATIPTASPLGDYNRNSVADAGDYVLWRKTSGATGVAPNSGADGSGNGSIGPEDYTIWRSHFGATGGAGSGEEAGSTEQGAGSLALSKSNASPIEQPPAVPGVRVALPFFYALEASESRSDVRASMLRTIPPAEPGADGLLRDDALVAWLSLRSCKHGEAASDTGWVGDGQDCPSYADAHGDANGKWDGWSGEDFIDEAIGSLDVSFARCSVAISD